MTDPFFRNYVIPSGLDVVQGTFHRIGMMNELINFVPQLQSKYNVLARDGEAIYYRADVEDVLRHAISLRPYHRNKQTLSLYDFLAVCYHAYVVREELNAQGRIDRNMRRELRKYFTECLILLSDIAGTRNTGRDDLLNHVSTMLQSVGGVVMEYELERNAIERFQFSSPPYYEMYDGDILDKFQYVSDMGTGSNRDYIFEVFVSESECTVPEEQMQFLVESSFNPEGRSIICTWYRTIHTNPRFYVIDPVTGVNTKLVYGSTGCKRGNCVMRIIGYNRE
jgi:hypothetical protein